ncbi:MAG: FecCD family ABC transporter permease [Solitalea-like symbiont of Tyrophagus putrescentiae]
MDNFLRASGQDLDKQYKNLQSTSTKSGIYKKHRIILASLSIILVVVFILSLCLGAVKISFPEFADIIMYRIGVLDIHIDKEPILFAIRLPRAICAILVGSCLAITGASMQGLFKNPLAEPGLLGISAGASLFASLHIVILHSILFNLSYILGAYSLIITSFIGAILTTTIVYKLSLIQGKAMITTLLISGIAINALAGSFTGLLSYISTDEQLRSITFWTMGSLGGSNWTTVNALIPFTLIPTLILAYLGKSLNAISLGDEEANYLGIRVNKIKKLIIVLTSLSVGAAVSMTGVIGFIGLVTPHILRLCFVSDNRLILPASAILGAILLSLADLLSRVIVAPSEVPIGIITALVGVPIFIYIILKDRKKYLFT